MSWKVRRVVTGCNAAGRSLVVSDGEPPGIRSRPGLVRAELWSIPAGPLSPESGGEYEPREDDLEPLPGAITWKVLRIAPSDAPHHPPREQLERDPRYDVNRPGMHRTDTIDWVTILDGEVELNLEDETVRLGPGDCVIQRGTWHSWRVVGEHDCVLGAMMMRSTSGGDPAFEGPGPRTSEVPRGVGPRRIVTHVRGDGRSVIAHDGEPANVLRFDHAAGMAYSDIWQTLGPVMSPAAGGDAPPGRFEFDALAGGAAWKHRVIPPDATLAEADPDALAAEYAEKASGMAEGGERDPDRPGRHRTNSIDLVQILKGRITLILDEDEVTLGPGEFVVQRGTWHAWSNRGEEPCIFQAMMIATEPL